MNAVIEIEKLERAFVELETRVSAAAIRSGRLRKDITLVAVSKKQPVEKMLAVQELIEATGAPVVFGENYVQELIEKEGRLAGNYSVHLIGALQRNKATLAVKHFDLIESVHSLPLAQELNKRAKDSGELLPVFLQVNISKDPKKAGFLPHEVMPILKAELQTLENLKICGLMTITQDYSEIEMARPDFKALKQLGDTILNLAKIKSSLGTEGLSLSMGMSKDFEIAIEEGATHIRVGSALFGAR